MVYTHSSKEQSWLLPPSIEDLIPEDHICILIKSLIESLDFSSFDNRYDGPFPGDILHSLADISKAQEKLNYEPRYTLEKGLEETIKCFQK